ncbi:MAG: hypothetical protein KDA75_21360 [Planctomycetaceae bacterium]|nr:hypothetical protein [Planctomycetaceae bacterium]
MSPQVLLWLALAGPDAADPAIHPLPLTAAPWTADELEQESVTIVSRARDPEQFDARRDVPELLQLRAAIVSSDALSRARQVRNRRKIDYCLEKALERLDRQRAHLAKGSLAKTSPTARTPGESVRLNGGSAEAARVQQLIDLIEMTIQPESWANNGGLGAIGYWSPGYALVIRNTQAVHAQIGGALGEAHAQAR